MCLPLIRSPGAPGTHFWACLKISDPQLSRPEETKYAGKNETKQMPRPPQTFKMDVAEQNPPMSLGKQGAFLSVLEALKSCLCPYCLPLSIFHLPKSCRASKRLQGSHPWCAHHCPHFTSGCPAMAGELPAYC